MHDQQITYLSSNQRRTHTVHFLCCFAVNIASNIKAFAILSSAIFLSSLSWCEKWHVSWFNDFIRRFSKETKPRPQKLVDFIDRLTPAKQCMSNVIRYCSSTNVAVSVCRIGRRFFTLSRWRSRRNVRTAARWSATVASTVRVWCETWNGPVMPCTLMSRYNLRQYHALITPAVAWRLSSGVQWNSVRLLTHTAPLLLVIPPSL